MPEWGGQTKSVHIDKNTGIGWSTCPEFAKVSIELMHKTLTHGIVHADFRGFARFVACKKSLCKLINYHLIIPYDTIPAISLINRSTLLLPFRQIHFILLLQRHGVYLPTVGGN